jgi:hypothetical protein
VSELTVQTLPSPIPISELYLPTYRTALHCSTRKHAVLFVPVPVPVLT